MEGEAPRENPQINQSINRSINQSKNPIGAQSIDRASREGQTRDRSPGGEEAKRNPTPPTGIGNVEIKAGNVTKIIEANLSLKLYGDCRGEAAQVHRLQQGVQPIIEPDHAHAQAHRLQALRLRPLREGLPAQGGPAPPPRLPAPVHGSSALASAAGTQPGPQI